VSTKRPWWLAAVVAVLAAVPLLVATVNSEGDTRVYVLSLTGNPAPGKVGSDGPYLR